MRNQHRTATNPPGGDRMPGADNVRERTGSSKGEALVNHHGVVLWCSRTVHEQFDAVGLHLSVGARCCDVLKCRDNTARGEPRCLTRLALAAPDPLRGRLWQSGLATAMISAQQAPATGSPLVIFELEFRDAVDAGAEERGRVPATGLEVQALGPMHVRVDGRPLGGDWLYQRTGQVFQYLVATRDRPARPDAIANALWPARERAVTNVRYGICKLREQLDAGQAGGSLILTSTDGYRLDPRRLRLDVDVFETTVAAGLEMYRAGCQPAAEDLLSLAASVYSGDFLADEPYAEWALTEREYLRRLACEALTVNARIALDAGRLVAATERLARLAELEPFDSQGHQLLIEVCLRRGRLTEALRRYDALSFRLDRTFGEKPDFDLAHIAARIRQREAGTRSSAAR
jgi:DNA-binding SARP family transcriptional activator